MKESYQVSCICSFIPIFWNKTIIQANKTKTLSAIKFKQLSINENEDLVEMEPDLDEKILHESHFDREKSFQLALKGINFLSEVLDENCKPEIEK